MHAKHVIKRGSSFHFVLRVPADLTLYFPTGTVSRSLKTKDKKQAAVLANAAEYEAQRLFMRLRTGMLDKSLENYLVNTFLLKGVKRIEAQNFAEGYEKGCSPDNQLEKIFDTVAEKRHKHNEMFRTGKRAPFDDAMPEYIEEHSELLRQALVNSDSEYAPVPIEALASAIKNISGQKLSEADKQRLGLRLIEAQIQLNRAEIDSLSGDRDRLGLLTASATAALAIPYVLLDDLKNQYLEYVETSQKGITRKQLRTVETECRVLQEILGNVGVAALNSQDSVESLHKALRRYPKTRQHMKGKLSAALGKGQPIGIDRANKYIKRAALVVDYAFTKKYTTGANIYRMRSSKLIDKNAVPADKRVLQYDIEDDQKLIDALCSAPLWTNRPAKSERFWAVLIGKFTGMRPGNIVDLKKEQVKVRRAKGGTEFCVFDLSHGKNDSTIRPVVIPEVLELLGFVEWVHQRPDGDLFQDNAKSFSAWYNNKQNGFQWRYITQNPRKKFYSLRHSYAGEIYNTTEDIKIAGEAMGHAGGSATTNRYIKDARPSRLKALVDQVEYEGIDVERLFVRAQELFFSKRQ